MVSVTPTLKLGLAVMCFVYSSTNNCDVSREAWLVCVVLEGRGLLKPDDQIKRPEYRFEEG